MRKTRRAQRQGWGVTSAMLKRLPKILNAIAEDENAPVRERVAAMKTIITMVGQNDVKDRTDPPAKDVAVHVYLPENGRDAARSL